MKEGIDLLTTQGGKGCPVCDRTARLGAEFPDYQLFRCGHCGCWSSDAEARGALTSFETVNYFENADLDRPKWEALFRRLESRGRKIQSVLDVGCGNGAFLAFVTAGRPDIYCEGIELDPGRARQARERNPEARIHLGEASELLPISSGPFDLITLWDVFEHVTAPARLLRQLAQCLRSNGSIHIVTIHERSIVPTLGRISNWLTRGRVTYAIRRTHEAHHLVFFTRKGLEIVARRAGLGIQELWFDRLLRARMDGHPALTAATATLLRLENALGNGLFVNLILEARS